MKKVVLDCGCAPWGQCKDAAKLSDRIAFEEAGVRVLAKAALLESGMAFAQAEVRVRRQTEKAESLKRALAAHGTP